MRFLCLKAVLRHWFVGCMVSVVIVLLSSIGIRFDVFLFVISRILG